MRADIARYRELARALNNERKGEADAAAKAFCSNVCVSMSLKYAHIYNGFAHLDVLDALPRQGDLFG